MKISEFLSENCHVLVVKLSVYLNRLVSIMQQHMFLWRNGKPVNTFWMKNAPFFTHMAGGGGGGGGGGNLGAVVVWVCEPVFRNLPHSYIWPLKKNHILEY